MTRINYERAREIAQSLVLDIYTNSSTTNAGQRYRNDSAIADDIAELGEMFGLKLVEEDEPEPLDAETVAQRQSYTECQVIAAGRGELL